MEGNTTTPQPAPSPVPLKSKDEASYRSQQPAAPSTPLPQRDISSSIASNLASARGIPANRQRRGSPASPASSTQHAEGKLTTPQRRSKLSDYPSRVASIPTQEKSTATVKTPGPPKIVDQPSKPPSSTDEAFNRFYSTFESLFTKLSAPLAFAGLPLGLEDTSTPEVAAATPNKQSAISEKFEDDPEYNNAFSRAALRAIRDERGLAAPAESFYVVPSTGGTISYANMLTRTKREAARSLGLPDPTEGEHADDEFVDARETPQPPSPVTSRKSGKGKGGRPANNKTMEELVIQNHAMEEFIDRLCKRVQEFEISSQSQNIALHQSFRMMQSQALPPQLSGAGVTSGGERNAANDERLAALEDQLKTAQKEIERMGRENEKLKVVVGRYRERWEKLKEGARTRREGTGTGTGGEG